MTVKIAKEIIAKHKPKKKAKPNSPQETGRRVVAPRHLPSSGLVMIGRHRILCRFHFIPRSQYEHSYTYPR